MVQRCADSGLHSEYYAVRSLVLPVCLASTALSGFAVVALAADTDNVIINQAASEAKRSIAPETQSAPGFDKSDFRVPLSDELRSKAVNARLLPADAKSLLRVRTKLRHGEYIWNDKDVPSGRVTIFVDVRRQMLSVFRNGHEIGTAVVVYGGGGNESPLGTFPILSKFRDYHSRTYDAPMPHSMFLTNDGVAIHGNVMAANRATKGCIGLPPEFAKLLFEVAKKGDVVQITRSEIPA